MKLKGKTWFKITINTNVNKMNLNIYTIGLGFSSFCASTSSCNNSSCITRRAQGTTPVGEDTSKTSQSPGLKQELLKPVPEGADVLAGGDGGKEEKPPTTSENDSNTLEEDPERRKKKKKKKDKIPPLLKFVFSSQMVIGVERGNDRKLLDGSGLTRESVFFFGRVIVFSNRVDVETIYNPPHVERGSLSQIQSKCGWINLDNLSEAFILNILEDDGSTYLMNLPFIPLSFGLLPFALVGFNYTRTSVLNAFQKIIDLLDAVGKSGGDTITQEQYDSLLKEESEAGGKFVLRRARGMIVIDDYTSLDLKMLAVERVLQVILLLSLAPADET